MTTNLGSHLIQEHAGEAQYDEMKREVMGVVSQHFRPEFINRVDDVVVFHPLEREQIRRITEIQVRYLSERLRERDLALELTDAALDVIGEAGFDPIYGARPLKRVLQQRVENVLAQRILAGEFSPGDRIRVDAVGSGEASELRFERISEPVVA